jgi:type IV secretory pathway protease TraF
VAQARVASGQVVKHAHSGVLHRFPADGLHVRCRSACSRTSALAVFAVPIAGILLVLIPALGLHVNLSASAPRGLYLAVAGRPTRGAWVVACVYPHAADLARARGYLRPGPCTAGVQPVLKPVIAVAGDVVEIGPDAVTVSGRRLTGSSSASLGRAYCRMRWGGHCRSGRAVACQHAGAEQLGQPLHRADLDVAGVVGRASRMDDRLMPPSSRAGDAEARGMALPSGHLRLSARLGSRHRRRRPPAPRGARRGRWGARRRGNCPGPRPGVHQRRGCALAAEHGEGLLLPE